MILQLLFYAKLETFKMQIELEKIGLPFENFWLRHCCSLWRIGCKNRRNPVCGENKAVPVGWKGFLEQMDDDYYSK